MPTFQQVLHVQLNGLNEAVTDWSETITKLEKAQEKAENGLRNKAEKADWAGENAGVTKEFVKKTAKEFGDALKEATSIRNVLRDAHSEFKAAKSALEKVIEEAPGKGIRIDPDGVISYQIHPDRRGKDYDGPKPTEADFEATRSAIKAALERANEADEIASRALRALVGKDKNDFSGTSYGGLKDASKAQDAEDAKIAYDLYKKGDDATPQEIDKLNKLFKDNKDDRYFAERFALEVGPKGSMEYWADMGDPSDGSRLGVDHRDKLKELQKNWSLTLASATHSTSPEMEQWKADVIKAGSEPIQTRGTSPYGFQVMSNLMRVGDYDDKFLRNYGNALVTTEQKMTHNGSLPPGRAWMGMGGMQNHLNWQGGGLGQDPMAGFMESLGHNPKASTEFFNSTIDVTPENGKDKNLNVFDYLNKDRDWPEELDDKGKMSKEPGYNSLGHALEAATTGRAYDAPTEGLKDVRTIENAEVMQKVVERYGSDPKHMHERPGIDDSLGKMGAAYIDEFNRSLEQENDTSMQEMPNSPFGNSNKDGSSKFGDKFDTELMFNRGDAVNFMGIVAQSETGHAQMSQAQMLYTTSVMDEVGPKPGPGPARELDLTDAKTNLRIGAETQSILDQSRMAQIDAQYEKDSEEHKKAVGRTTEWVKFGTGVVITGGVAALTGGAGAALVPLAAETVGGAVTTYLGMEAADIAEKYEKDELLQKNSDELKKDALQTGVDNTRLPAQAYARAPGWSQADANYLEEELTKYVKDSRQHVRDDSLPDPYKPKK